MERKKTKRFKLKMKRASTKKGLVVLKNRIAYYLSIGLTLEDSCKIADVDKGLLNLLRSDPEFDEFIEKHYVVNEYDHLKAIHSAGQNGQWQASAWFLERTRPDKYGRRDLVRHEYQIKFNTLQKVFIEVLDDVDPYLRVRLLKKLKNYEFDGSTLLGNKCSVPMITDETDRNGD